jgi:hypothetical protein
VQRIAAALNSIDPTEATSDPAIALSRDQFIALIDPARAGDGNRQSTQLSPANDDYVGGRPFVVSIDLQMGRSAKDQLLDLELAKTDLAEIPAEETRPAAERGVRLASRIPTNRSPSFFYLGLRLPETLGCERHWREPSTGRPSRISSLRRGASLPADCAKEQWPRIAGSPKILLRYDAGDALRHTVAGRMRVNRAR